MDLEQIIKHAISLIRAGRKAEGRELLRQVLQAEPNNPDVWFIYAQYCGRRDQAIDSLQRVLVLDPYYPGAREALDKISLPEAKNQSVFILTEEDSNWSPPAQEEINPAKQINKKTSAKMPRWFLYVAGGLFACLCLAGIMFGMYLLTNMNTVSASAAPASELPAQPGNISTQTPAPTITPLIFSTRTPTPDPCTCEAVGPYLERSMTRANVMYADLDKLYTEAYRGTLSFEDVNIYGDHAERIYNEERNEVVPYCLEGYHSDVKRVLWNWEQATTAIEDLDRNSITAFLDNVTVDSEKIQKELDKLKDQPSLQSCNFVLPTPYPSPTPRGYRLGVEIACVP